MKKSIANAPGTALTDWIRSHMDDVKAALTDEGLVLFRGFDTEDAATLKETLFT